MIIFSPRQLQEAARQTIMGMDKPHHVVNRIFITVLVTHFLTSIGFPRRGLRCDELSNYVMHYIRVLGTVPFPETSINEDSVTLFIRKLHHEHQWPYFDVVGNGQLVQFPNTAESYFHDAIRLYYTEQ